ncbi:MAG TPA: hypothetical protein VFY93_10875, partial [Planctomycetota bacterium]|nr:hypothetical protein [Planctomycetota bacterium]
RDRLVIAEPRVPVETLRQRSFEDDGPPYASLARQVELASGRAVTTFLGAEKPDPGKPFVVGPENPEWSAQEVRADVRRLHWCSTRARRAAFREELKKERFGFLYRWREGDTLHAAFGDWTPLGPLLARQRAIWDVLSAADVGVRDEERDELYVLRARALIRCPLAHPQQSEVLRVPDTLPEARESSALAIDTRRQRLLLATRHELGYLYALDLVKREWSVLNDLDGVDASGMFFDERRDAVLCVERRKDGTLRLERFSPEDGRHLNGTALRVPPLPDDRPLAGACLGNHLILLYPPPESQAHRVGEDSLAFVVDAITGDLIHGDRVRCWEDFEPVPEPRLARMWEALSAPDDDAEAGRAMRWLAGQGDRGVAFLAERFKPVPGTAEDLGRWVRMLSDDDTLRRDLAQFRLVDAGARAQEYLAGLDLDALPPEARRRVAAALRQVEEPGRNRRALRAIAVLEWIDTRAAEALLKELAAKGDPRRTAAAEQALLRMSAPRR